MGRKLKSWVSSHVKDLLSPSLASTGSISPTTCNDPPRPSVKRSDAYIDILPLEMLCEIFKHIEWQDLLRATLTCRVWHQAIQSKQLWCSLAKELELRRGIGRSDEPLEDYTIRELQNWVLRRLRAQGRWNAESVPLTFNQRKLQFSKLQCTAILPGGRWFLLSNFDGKLYSYDLDSSHPEQRLLIDPGLGDDDVPDNLQQFNYWIDPSKRKLSFRVVLWNIIRNKGREITRTSVYEINLSGHGEESFLEAKPNPIIILKDNEQDPTRWAVALTGKYLVECRFVEAGNLLSLIQYIGGENDIPGANRIQFTLTTSSRPYELYVTSDHIVVVTLNQVDVYAISQFLDHHSKCNQLSPVHRIPCDRALRRSSPPYALPHCIELVHGYHDQLYLTRISADKNEPVTIIKLGDQSLYNDDRVLAFLGPAACFFLHADSINTVTYSWDENMESVNLFSKHSAMSPDLNIVPRMLSPLCVEKGIGRIIFVGYQSGKCVVLDTA